MRGYFFHAIHSIFSLEWIQLGFGRDRTFVDNLPHYALQNSVRFLEDRKFIEYKELDVLVFYYIKQTIDFWSFLSLIF